MSNWLSTRNCNQVRNVAQGGSCEIAPFLKVYMLDDHKFMDLPRSAVHFGSSDFFGSRQSHILAQVLRIKRAPLWGLVVRLSFVHCLVWLAVPIKQLSFISSSKHLTWKPQRLNVISPPSPKSTAIEVSFLFSITPVKTLETKSNH